MIIEIIFSPSAGSMALKTVTFESVEHIEYGEGGVAIQHSDSEETLYFYPYHTIGRVKEIDA